MLSKSLSPCTILSMIMDKNTCSCILKLTLHYYTVHYLIHRHYYKKYVKLAVDQRKQVWVLAQSISIIGVFIQLVLPTVHILHVHYYIYFLNALLHLITIL